MKKRTEYLVCIIITLLYAGSLYSQGLTIGSGTAFSLGGATLSLPGNLADNGTINAGTSTVIFNGASGNQTITNASGETFYNLTVDKTSGNVITQNDLNANGSITCTSGNLDLNGNSCTLGSSGLVSETNNNGVIGGSISITKTLNSPSSANPGNLGAEITSSANLGATLITRVTGLVDKANGNSSIKRNYKILPANDNGLNATLVFNYFPDELNGLTESNLVLFKSNNDTTWTNAGGTVNTTNHTVTLNGINSFSYWTLGSSTSPLPVELTSFMARTVGSKVELNWKTATEVNNFGFEVERSAVSDQQSANVRADSRKLNAES